MTLQTTDAELVHIFNTTKTIALVGTSLKPNRPSYRVGTYLVDLGYHVIPINPSHAGKTLFGQTIVDRLTNIDRSKTVDMIDIFSRSEQVADEVDIAMAIFPNLKTIWMQLDIKHAQAAQKASQAGILVIQDRCPKIEYPRLQAKAHLQGSSA